MGCRSGAFPTAVDPYEYGHLPSSEAYLVGRRRGGASTAGSASQRNRYERLPVSYGGDARHLRRLTVSGYLRFRGSDTGPAGYALHDHVVPCGF
jgi:hypothetical protein